jgi:hypothetical protein
VGRREEGADLHAPSFAGPESVPSSPWGAALAPVGEAGPKGRDERRERHEQHECANPSHGFNPLSPNRTGIGAPDALDAIRRPASCGAGPRQNRKSCSASAARR